MSSTDSLPVNVSLVRPSKARYIVLGFLCSMACVLYLDRVCIAQALVPMKTEFGWSNTQASVVLMAFTLAYGLFEIPTGQLGDRYGSRGVLTRIVLWWSAFTALTGSAYHFTYILDFQSFPIVFNTLTLVVLIRFWFGAGEAGAMPNAARIMLRWFPDTERGSIQGWFQASMHIGGTVAPIVAALIIDLTSWRWTFFFFGQIGVVWAACFYWWFRDKPTEHPAVNQAEAQLIGAPPHGDVQQHDSVPWRQVLVHPNVWLLSIIIIMSAFNSYFFFSWYSTYLQEARQQSNRMAGLLSALALLGATVGSVLGGYVSDFIAAHAADRYRARRILCLVGFSLAAVCLFSSVFIEEAVLSALLCALACTLMFCQLPTWWACAFDVSGKHTGALFGLLNGIGVVGALGSQYFFGAFADWRKNLGFTGRDQWDPAFYVAAALLLVAGLLWQLMYPRRAVG